MFSKKTEWSREIIPSENTDNVLVVFSTKKDSTDYGIYLYSGVPGHIQLAVEGSDKKALELFCDKLLLDKKKIKAEGKNFSIYQDYFFQYGNKQQYTRDDTTSAKDMVKILMKEYDFGHPHNQELVNYINGDHEILKPEYKNPFKKT